MWGELEGVPKHAGIFLNRYQLIPVCSQVPCLSLPSGGSPPHPGGAGRWGAWGAPLPCTSRTLVTAPGGCSEARAICLSAEDVERIK